MPSDVPAKYVEKAITWRNRHMRHVDDLVANAPASFPPSGSDVLSPELWKGGHWKWLYETQNLKAGATPAPTSGNQPANSALRDAINTLLWLRHEHRAQLAPDRFAQITALAEQAKIELIEAERNQARLELLSNRWQEHDGLMELNFVGDPGSTLIAQIDQAIEVDRNERDKKPQGS